MSGDIIAVSLLNAVSYAILLFLIASGLALIYGVMGVLNLAHGSLYMLGAYLGLTAVRLGGNWVLAIFAAGVMVAVVGLAMDRGILSHLYKRVGEQALITVGLVYIFLNAVIWIWGPFSKMGNPPTILSANIEIGSFQFPSYRFFLIAVGLAIAAGLWLLQDKTRAGAIVRAGMQDKEMTMALGIDYALVSTAIFCLGGFLAGVAGFMGTPLLGAYWGMGIDVLLLAIIAVVVGGVGYVQGTLLGAILIGVIDSFGKVLFPDLAYFTIYLVMIVVLVVRPSGLLARKR